LDTPSYTYQGGDEYDYNGLQRNWLWGYELDSRLYL